MWNLGEKDMKVKERELLGKRKGMGKGRCG
jgi:hypothetical protein